MKKLLIMVALLNANGILHASNFDESEHLYSEEYLRRARENALKGDEDFDIPEISAPEISALEVASQDAPTLLFSPPQLTMEESASILLVCSLGIVAVWAIFVAWDAYANSNNVIQKYL